MSFSGIIAGVGIFGPAIAFFLGGLFSRIYVTLEGMYKKSFPPCLSKGSVLFVVIMFMSLILDFP